MATAGTDTDQLHRRNRELVILNAIAEALNRPVDLDHSLSTALSQVADLLDLKTGWVFLLDEETDVPYLAASQNLPPGLAEDHSYFEGSCYCLDTYRAGDLNGAANVNVVRCSRLKWLDDDGSGGLRYHSSIPLYAAGRKIGVMNVASTDWRALSEDDLRILHTVGDLLGIAVERSRLFARTARMGALEERNRLAREIHDTLAQGLAGIALQLESAEALLDGEAPKERLAAIIRQALDQTRLGLEEARRSVLDLRAVPLDAQSFSDAVRGLVEEWRKDHDIELQLELRGINRPLPVRVESGLYRLLRESLVNIARHSRASHASVTLDLARDEVQMIVTDNGVGFDPEEVGEGRFGLRGMNERLHLLGGRLDVQSAKGRGTQLHIHIPL